MSLKIREATLEDAPRLLEIYTPYVENTDITFEYVPPTIEEFQERMKNVMIKFPYLVILSDDQIIGYAYASDYRTRIAYQYVSELSIYIDNNFHHMHAGTILYQKLMDILKKQNYQIVYACITYPNDASIAFHKKLGFEQIAYFKNCGFKQNHWLDMIWMEKRINEQSDRQDIINYNELEKNQ